MIYDRKILMQVVVYHPKVDIKGCLCGWSELGKDHSGHVADVYEAAAELIHGPKGHNVGPGD